MTCHHSDLASQHACLTIAGTDYALRLHVVWLCTAEADSGAVIYDLQSDAHVRTAGHMQGATVPV